MNVPSCTFGKKSHQSGNHSNWEANGRQRRGAPSEAGFEAGLAQKLPRVVFILSLVAVEFARVKELPRDWLGLENVSIRPLRVCDQEGEQHGARSQGRRAAHLEGFGGAYLAGALCLLDSPSA